MSKIIKSKEDDAGLIGVVTKPINRQSFFKYMGAGAALTTLVLAGCDDDDSSSNGGGGSGVDLGSGDAGVLNYAYALEQLEAAFYTQVVASAAFSTTFPSALERAILTDIRDHEIAHREFFKAAINAVAPGKIIQNLTPDFSTVNFNDRTAVLATAKTFEDLGVAAYNGAGKLLTNKDFLTLAGKIVSVEARHAAEIRDIISNGTFASGPEINAQGMDKALMPADVLAAAKPFIKETINFNNLPTS